jgi:hypothetical protein
MNGLQRIDVHGMRGIHVVLIGGDELAGAVVGIAIVDAKILDAQAADGRGHPAILVAVIVNARALADFPTDGHALEEGILENEIASVAALGEEAVFFEGLGADVVGHHVVLYGFKSEVPLVKGGEIIHPGGDGELFGDGLLRHQTFSMAVENNARDRLAQEL